MKQTYKNYLYYITVMTLMFQYLWSHPLVISQGKIMRQASYSLESNVVLLSHQCVVVVTD